MKRSFVLLAGCALLAANAARAQDYDGRLAFLTEWTIAAGSTADFEAGLKRHNEVHARHDDPVPLLTWEVVTGEDAGKYWRGSFGQHWADFDQDEVEGDAEDSAVNLDPYITAAVPRIWGMMAEVSNAPDSPGPAALAEVVEFRVHMDGMEGFMGAIKSAHAATVKSEWPVPYLWYALVNGGMRPTFALVLPHDDWADFKEPDPSFGEMVFGALGAEAAGEMMSTFGATIKSEKTYVLAFRPDLSYLPSAGDSD